MQHGFFGISGTPHGFWILPLQDELSCQIW